LKAANAESRSIYFDLQAGWGVSKHLGGGAATRELASLCSIDAASDVLVAGCGNGFSACALAQSFGCRVIGIDINPAMVEQSAQHAQRLGLTERVAFRDADARALPFPEGQFDVVFSESVNSFIPEPTVALREYSRVLAEAGRVGINECVWLEPPPPGLARYMKRVMGARFLVAGDAWETLLGEAGFMSPTASIHRMTLMGQWKSEMEQLDARQVLRAWLTLPWTIAKDAESRRWLLSTLAAPPAAMRLLRYFGYGLFTATKPPRRTGP